MANWFKILLLFLVINSNNQGLSCPIRKFCKPYTYKPYIERIKYLVRLPNTRKLSDLSLIGTHDSLSYSISSKTKTQDLTIHQQLKYGIRVLDVTVHPYLNFIQKDFAATRFYNFLSEINWFLDDNPGEFIIILVSKILFDKSAQCDILDSYIKNTTFGLRLVKNWQLDDSIGKHRGKILLASLDSSFRGCAFDINRSCLVQNQDVLAETIRRSPTLKDRDIFMMQMIGNTGSKRFPCYINDINFADGVNERRLIAKDGLLVEGDTCREPSNYLMTREFRCRTGVLNIVIADFVTQELIDKVNDCNFPNSSWRIGWD